MMLISAGALDSLVEEVVNRIAEIYKEKSHFRGFIFASNVE